MVSIKVQKGDWLAGFTWTKQKLIWYFLIWPDFYQMIQYNRGAVNYLFNVEIIDLKKKILFNVFWDKQLYQIGNVFDEGRWGFEGNEENERKLEVSPVGSLFSGSTQVLLGFFRGNSSGTTLLDLLFLGNCLVKSKLLELEVTSSLLGIVSGTEV